MVNVETNRDVFRTRFPTRPLHVFASSSDWFTGLSDTEDDA